MPAMLVPHRQQRDFPKMCYSRSHLNRLGLTTGEVGLYPAKLQPPLNSPWTVLLSYSRWTSEHQTQSAPASGGSRVIDEKYFEGRGRTGNQIPKPGNVGGRQKVTEVPHRGIEEENCHSQSCPARVNISAPPAEPAEHLPGTGDRGCCSCLAGVTL